MYHNLCIIIYVIFISYFMLYKIRKKQAKKPLLYFSLLSKWG